VDPEKANAAAPFAPSSSDGVRPRCHSRRSWSEGGGEIVETGTRSPHDSRHDVPRMRAAPDRSPAERQLNGASGGPFAKGRRCPGADAGGAACRTSRRRCGWARTTATRIVTLGGSAATCAAVQSPRQVQWQGRGPSPSSGGIACRWACAASWRACFAWPPAWCAGSRAPIPPPSPCIGHAAWCALPNTIAPRRTRGRTRERRMREAMITEEMLSIEVAVVQSGPVVG
jgi:hypothetical protein